MQGVNLVSRFYATTAIYMGKDGFKEAVGKARRVFVIADPFMVKSGLISCVTDHLKEIGAECEIFSEIRPDPDIETVAAGMGKYIDFKPDCAVAIGGGSAIDAGKAIVYFAAKKDSAMRCPFIAIPTTSGTGSEVTTFSVITDHKKNVKYPVIDDSMLPTAAVLNPELIMSVPPKVTVDTGLDALTHAIEAYVSTDRTDFTDALAEKAVRIINKYLPLVYKDPKNAEYRQRVHNASCMAGMAFSNAGLGLNHAMAHTIGGKFHVAHGRANAILLSYVMHFNAGCATHLTPVAERYAKIAYIWDISTKSVRQSALNVIRRIRAWEDHVGVPRSFKEFGIDEGDYLAKVDEMVSDAMADSCMKTTPQPCTKDELKALFIEAYGGARRI